MIKIGDKVTVKSFVSRDKVEYNDKFSCLLNKSQYKDSESIKFFCAEKDLFNKID